MSEPVRAGLIGAGPWAGFVHAPALSTHPDIDLVGIWARRPEAAATLAAEHGTRPFGSVDELISAVDVVAFAVPPAVQAELAVRAADAGRHLILEKPIASTVDDAARLADTVSRRGVASIVMLRMRFEPQTRQWLHDLAHVGGWRTGSARWLSGGLLGGPFSSSPWRHADGALADVGPHVVDLLDAALGEVTEVLAARYAEPDVWHLILAHRGGATSTATLSMRLPLRPTISSVDVYGEHGHSMLTFGDTPATEDYAAMVDDLLVMIRSGSTSHPVDVHRGLHLQRVLHAARELTRTWSLS